MQNLGTFFLWALVASILGHGSFAEDQSGYICPNEDPKQNQCNSIYLTQLNQRLDKVVKAQNKGNTNTRDGINVIKSKLGRLEVKIEEERSTLEGQLRGVENKLEGHLQEMQAKLEESLLAVQKMIEIQLQAVVNQLQLVQNKKNAVEVKSQLQAISNKTAAPQQVAKVAVSASSTITIPSGFELIGSRYFRFVKEWANWETAERRCREMGGYLATFRNEEEINAILDKFGKFNLFWLGINDHGNEGHFVSVASQKPAPFFKWFDTEPNDKDHEQNCVFVYASHMWDNYCNKEYYFVCQADNET